MDTRTQRVCAWMGPALVITFFFGFAGVARWMPPPNPTAGADVIAAIYRERPSAILAGQIISMAAIGFLAFWAAAISAQMRRMKGAGPLLANAQVALAAISTIVFIWPQFFWVAAAFRPERAPSELLLLNDLGWLPFVANVYTGVPWILTIAWAILSDKSETPILPRWSGFLCLSLEAMFLCTSLCLFFKVGPFSWNGTIVFWVPIVTFGSFLLIFSYCLLKAIKRQELEERADRAAASGSATDTGPDSAGERDDHVVSASK